MGGSPHSAGGLGGASTAAASNSDRPVGLVCEPCQAVGWMYAQYDDRWNTPIPLAQVCVRDINGAVIDEGGRTKGLATFGLEDGIPHQSVRNELGTYAFQAPQEGRLVVELVPEPVGLEPAELEAQIVADLETFQEQMETALEPWAIAWEERGVRGLIGSFFRNIRSGASSWWDDQEDLWTAIGNWLSSLPDLAADAWDGAVTGAKELWENRDKILQLMHSFAHGLVKEFQSGFEAILELVESLPGLDEIAEVMRLAFEHSAEWSLAMIEMATKTKVLHALGATMMGIMAMVPPNFWTDMVGLGVGYLIPEIILAIIFMLIAFFSAGLGGGLLVTKLTAFANNVVTKVRAAGAAVGDIASAARAGAVTESVGSVVARIFDTLMALKSKVVDLAKSLKSRISERANGATGEATPIMRSAEPDRPSGAASDGPSEGDRPARPKSARERYLGSTPGKKSRTGGEVRERMRQEGNLRTDDFGADEFLAEDGRWYPVDTPSTHMGHHPVDAVDWWNSEGYQHGAKSQTVRDWMLDSNNYRFEHGPLNSARGGATRSRYRDPL